MTDEWKDVVGYEDMYQVSDAGEVRSVDRTVNINGVPSKLLGVVLKQHETPFGYTTVKLFRNGSGKTIRVHRLVAEAFIPNSKRKIEVNHINRLKNDNRVGNLEWATRLENSRHARATGVKVCLGEVNPNAKLNNTKVRIIRRMCEMSIWSDPEIGEIFSVSSCTVRKVRKRVSWKHVRPAEMGRGG